MYILAYGLLMLALFCCLGGAAFAILQLYQGRTNALKIVEGAQVAMTSALVLASAILLHALFWNDFSLIYVASYTDRVLPIFYRLTAFWAGQAGSLLFWALSVALCGLFFLYTKAYKGLSETTRLWFWIFFLIIMGFFALLLTSWSNPFIVQTPVPPDGNGLNPLLQNPGMIFHPPLLFWGYGGFVIPGCLALAQCLSGKEKEEGSWVHVARPFTLLAWLFLTAGIVLGAWWAYMELGWGGYWAWDPVENASLIPWLIGTAAIHTMIIESRRNKLGRTNVFLMALTTISAFFATYLVRSGVINSVHAFGDGGVGMPLLIFILASTAICAWIAFFGNNSRRSLAGIDSHEGMLVVTAWILLMLSVIICIATLWPLISLLFSDQSQGLAADFYNRVCLPLFALISVILAFCPWIGWNGGLRDTKKVLIIAATFILTGIALWFTGYRTPTAFIATCASVAAIVSIGLLFMDKAVRSQRNTVAAFGVHIGLIMLVVGIAFSGPYKIEGDFILSEGESAPLGDYIITLSSITTGSEPQFNYMQATLQVKKDDTIVGEVAPQLRQYFKFGNQRFFEAATLFSLGDEIYASLLTDNNTRAQVRVSINPLVNWMWIGGTLMCLFPFMGLGRRKTKNVEDTD